MLNNIYTISIALVLLSCTVSVDAGAAELQLYCTTLKQTQADTNTCFEYPRQWSLNGDPFILAYMCCYGYFNNVAVNYKPYLSDSFAQWFAGLTNSDTLQNIAYFILMCAKDPNLLTEGDYSHWAANGGQPNFCKQ